MSAGSEPQPGSAEEAAEETWASLPDLYREAVAVYERAHRTLASAGIDSQSDRSARAAALEAARRLTELARNCDLLERAAPESALVAHLVSGRRQLRALADSLLLLSSVRVAADLEMLPLLGPQELRAELRSQRSVSWLEGPRPSRRPETQGPLDPFSDFDWA